MWHSSTRRIYHIYVRYCYTCLFVVPWDYSSQQALFVFYCLWCECTNHNFLWNGFVPCCAYTPLVFTLVKWSKWQYHHLILLEAGGGQVFLNLRISYMWLFDRADKWHWIMHYLLNDYPINCWHGQPLHFSVVHNDLPLSQLCYWHLL